MNNIEKRMQEIKPSGLSGSEKERIWSTMEKRLVPHTGFSLLSGLPTFKTFRRVSVPLVVALGLILGGGATVYANEVAVPGDLLFPVKKSVEKTQIFFAKDEKKKDELRIKFSEGRLKEVQTLVASSPDTTIAAGANASLGVSASSTSASSTGESALSKKDARTERAIRAALAELEETKASLALSGSDEGVLILDDIIAELRGVGDGTVTITKISTKGGKHHDDDVKVYATITATSTGTTTANVISRVKFEDKDKKEGAKLEVKTSIFSGLWKGKGEEEKNDSKNDHGDAMKREKSDEHERESKKDEGDEDEDDDDGKLSICHRTGEGALTINVSAHSARAHMSHGDTLGICGTESQPTTDTTAPLITGITVNVTATSATLAWVTNENATGELYLGTTSPVVTSRTPDAAHTALLSAHSLTASSLLPSTTYYYVLVSKDASGNSATSSSGSFSTPAAPPVLDTTAPVISNIAATTALGTTTISFSTNEPATGTVYVGTTNPLVIGSATSVALPTLGVTQSAVFSGLATSTTHYYVIVAKDASLNTATSSQGSFLTN